MRNGYRFLPVCGLSAALIVALSACAAKAPVKGPKSVAEIYQETPVPTVPPSTPTPVPSASPIPTQPSGTQVKARKGEPIGPIVTFFGAARADGTSVEPKSIDKKGIPTYASAVGSGFMLVVEAKPGPSGFDPAARVLAYVPDDPKSRPDLEIEANRNMGDGSPAVCDRNRPKIGGIPGINPPSFAETQRVSDAINDLACRFETFVQSDASCTQAKNGEYSFVNSDSTTQFCMIVARAWAFPPGETLLSVRVRDNEGNPGPVKQMRILRPPDVQPGRAQKKK
jgi:hypothetical protein